MSRFTGPAGVRRRGQSGFTLIEVLITVVLGSLVLVPLFGLVVQVMRQRSPTVESAAASKQLSIFRSVLASDWSSAEVILIDPPVSLAQPYLQCNGQGYDFLPNQTGPRHELHGDAPDRWR